MTGKQQRAWEPVARAAADAAPIYAPGREARAALAGRLSDQLIDAELWRAGYGRKSIAVLAGRERFEATVTAVLAGLTLDEVADAMRAGWPGLGLQDARVNVEGYIERQGDLDRAYLRRGLTSMGE